MSTPNRPEVSLYRRNAAHITDSQVLHPLEKEAQISAAPFRKRKKMKEELESLWAGEEKRAADAATDLLVELRKSATALGDSLEKLVELKVPELRGKVEAEQLRARAAVTQIEQATKALRARDFGAAGLATDEAGRELFLVGGPLVVALNQVLGQAAVGRESRERLQANFEQRKRARRELERARREGGASEGLQLAAVVHLLEAEGYSITAETLAAQIRPAAASSKVKVGRDNELRVIPPNELETFARVGGLDDVKDRLRNTIGAILERPDEAARYQVVHNGILFHGPPGTGKTLLSRALAGEYGLRYIRFSPASIASAYIHEAAANLQRVFETAAANVPCVLFLDEIDTIASARDDQPSADHREVVTQLMNSLEEYRAIPGLVIIGATNNIDALDPGLREGRFDERILVPLPDPHAREEIIKVHLDRRQDAVDWAGIDLEELATKTSGRNAAALESFVSQAAQKALGRGEQLSQQDLIAAISEREGKDRVSLDQPVRWDDVVLAEDVQDQLLEILNVFMRPDLALSLGVSQPAGLLLHGPPGTGKTTIARAMATEISASFYEQSAADLLSKWAGESEERVAKLFTKARANRPSIIFIDEIDGLLRRRSGDSASPWEERVVSQFLRELDGLAGSQGVLLVGATNRLDIIDPAISGRRLTPIEIGLPNATGRSRLLDVLCAGVKLAPDVDLNQLVTDTEGLSGADLKRMRDAAGMKALNRGAKEGQTAEQVAISMVDLVAALDAQRNRSSLIEV